MKKKKEFRSLNDDNKERDQKKMIKKSSKNYKQEINDAIEEDEDIQEMFRDYEPGGGLFDDSDNYDDEDDML